MSAAVSRELVLVHVLFLYHGFHKDEDAIVTLGIAIPLDPSTQTEPYSLHTKLLADASLASTQTTGVLLDNFLNLPYHLDPNLGIIRQLPSSNIEYEISTFNSWNIEPHFLNFLPLSTTVSSESSILMFGGIDPSSVLKKSPPDCDHKDFVLGSTIFQYLLNSKSWKYYGTMIEPRCYHACVLDGQYVYITGGYSLLKREYGEMLAVSSTDRLNLNNRQWSRCANMVIARASHAVVSHNGSLYAFGGRDSLGNFLSSIEVYYPEQDTWSEITSLPQPCMGLSATCIRDTIWLIGGIIDNGSDDPSKCLLSTVYSFIPQTNRWCQMEPLPYGCAFSSCISDCDSLWLIGGCTSKNSKEDYLISCSAVLQLVLYERPSKWKEVTSLLYPRHALTTVLYDGDIYVLAGIASYNNCASNKMEVINTATNTQIDCPDIPVSVTGSTSVLILEETVNYMCLKCGKSHAHASKTSSDLSQRENYLSDIKKDYCTSAADKTIDTENHLKTSYEDVILDKTKKVEDFLDNENIEEIIENEEYHQKDTLSSHVKNEDEKKLKYRASMEILLNLDGKEDFSSYALHENKSASRWLNYFHTLSASDEELQKEIFQMNEPNDSKLQEDSKGSEKGTKTDNSREIGQTIENSSYISTSVQSSMPSHKKSFIYVQSNLKSQRLDEVSDSKSSENTHFEESFESISSSNTCELEVDILPAPSDTENITIDEESFPIILLMGGEYRGNSKKSRYILSYDCVKNVWNCAGYMPVYRCHHCVVFLSSKIYVIGGFDSKNSKLYENITRKSLCYDIYEKTWYHIAEMNYSRAYHCALVWKNEIYVLGGRDQLGNILESVEVYNESTNEWKECNSLPYPVLGAAASVVKNVLYLFGGITYKDENEIISCNTTIFNPEDKSWSMSSDLPVPLSFCGISSSLNSVWLFGGLKEEEGNIVSGKDIFQFDVHAKIWSKVAELSASRHASVTVSLGMTVFVIGGHSTQLKKEVLTCEKINVLNNEVLIQESLPIAVSGRSGIVITEITKNDINANSNS